MRIRFRIHLRTALAIALAGAGAERALAEDATDAFKSFPSISLSRKMPKLTGFNTIVTDPTQNGELKDVEVEALLTTEGPAVESGLTWRVFSPIPDSDGKLPLLATSEGGSTAFNLVPGEYFVNVAFGRAGATRKIRVPEQGTIDKQVLILDAGGVMLNAVSGSDVRIPPNELSFSIYSSDVKEDGERALIVADVKPDTVVRLSAGTYHVVSDYGSVNAVIRADIQVEAGKLTEATIQHRAAKLTLKLVSEPGGEAIADTAWSILTSSGDVVSESVGAFPTLVLAEGGYSAVARNKDKIYQRDFTVKAGVNTDVEVLLHGNDAPDEAAAAEAQD
ncbi:hypothetical protein [Sinorhizobium alkalisoli]|uniref:Uncharacterized protein n=1 Tax=Sinorhizobium alkalisoli TaxID=1752398 RepID=A0A1E3VEF9_9HYPH|nr:hypothetical protein [Sinorhizobium alkalisoli]MCA1492876.1 hypothetical protein [Ensifer sp. NBAIM29]MCG5477966.1 hypothetical protein [Sinorhizobium alkalisoli]ODR91925.1 hypothetical protein A8M32_08015 [Sinorhizobium alkalisoli]QFI66073.1 hypothetical protein EKH55_1199 [Sinorhizobium alkalisoli]